MFSGVDKQDDKRGEQSVKMEGAKCGGTKRAGTIAHSQGMADS
jgi:hypothetical protein